MRGYISSYSGENVDQRQISAQLQKFLIELRERANLSQSDVAARSDVFGMGRLLDQRTVSRIEQQPLNVDALKIAAYLTAVGSNPNKYYEFLNQFTFSEDEKAMPTAKKANIQESIEGALRKIGEARAIFGASPHSYLTGLGIEEALDRSESLIKSLNRKPVIGFFGHFDAGKSTLINTVLNDNLLPTGYTPATCVVNLLMHEEDRPDTLTGKVALFRSGFKPHMIHNPELVAKYLIEEGDATLLDRLGVHNHDESIPNDAYIAVVFSEAQVLTNLWLLDTPGDLNSTDESDTEKALGGVELVDGVVFLSNHTGFFKDTDLGFASNILRQRPPADRDTPLAHILFVQSHCHSEIKTEDVRRVREITFKRLKNKKLDDLIFGAWVDDGYLAELPSPDALAERVQPFWRENQEYRTTTLARINQMGTFLNSNQETIVNDSIARTLDVLAAFIGKGVDTLQQRKQSTVDRIREVEEKDARFREEADEIINDFKELIASCKDRSRDDIEQMGDYYRARCGVDGLTAMIEEAYEDKKEAQSEIGNYIGQLLSAKLESVLKSSGKMISNEVEALLARWQKAAPSITANGFNSELRDLDVNVSAFNSRAAFIGGLAGLGSLGAMALYVSTIASNLGAYILVGKAAGVLTALGITSSVTTLTSFVAAIGGPITVGIAIAAAIGYLVYRLFGGSWQNSLAKKVAEAIEKEGVLEKLEKPIRTFWDSTKLAISAGLDELVAQTDEYIDELRADAGKNYDVGELDGCIAFLQRMKAPLAGHPRIAA